MEFINIVIVSVAIVFSFQSISSEAYVVYNISKKVGRNLNARTDPQIIIEHNSIENKSLSYAICKDLFDGDGKECSVLLETYRSNSEIYKDACKFILRPKENTSMITNYFKITRLANNKIIFGWLEKYSRSNVQGAFFKFRIVYFPGCSSSENALDLNSFAMDESSIGKIIVLAYDDSTYDVVHPNMTTEKNEWLRTTFDSNSNCIMDSKVWFEFEESDQLPKIYPLKYHSPSEGHIIIPSLTSTHKALLIKTDKVSKELAFATELPFGTLTVGSGGNNLISICSTNYTTYICTQFDVIGNELSKLTISYGYEAVFSSLYNLEQGGFLLVTIQASNTNLLYHVTKIDSFNVIYRTLEIPEFKCIQFSRAIASKIFITNNGEYCLALACRQYDFITTAHCFSDEELSVLF